MGWESERMSLIASAKRLARISIGRTRAFDLARVAREALPGGATVTPQAWSNPLVTERNGKKWVRLDVSPVAGAPERKDGPPAAEEAKKIAERINGWVYRISDYAASNLTKRMQNLVEDTKAKS